MKGAEAAVKWKEVKGHARKLRGKGDERTGRGARWPAVSRQRVNPATGRDRAAGQSPLGLTFRSPTMRRPCAEHAHTFYAGPSLIRGEGFAYWFRRFL